MRLPPAGLSCRHCNQMLTVWRKLAPLFETINAPYADPAECRFRTEFAVRQVGQITNSDFELEGPGVMWTLFKTLCIKGHIVIRVAEPGRLHATLTMEKSNVCIPTQEVKRGHTLHGS